MPYASRYQDITLSPGFGRGEEKPENGTRFDLTAKVGGG